MHKLEMVFGLPLILIGIWMYSEFGFFLPWFIAWILGIIVAIFIGTGWFPEMVKSWEPKDSPSRQLSFLPSTSKILTMPIIWTTTIFLAYNLPVIMKVGGALGYWSIAHTQWLNVPILQLASFTGMYGITFLILLVNCAVAYAIIRYEESKQISKQSIAVVLVFVAIFAYGSASVPEASESSKKVNVAIVQAPLAEDTDDTYVELSEESLKYDPQIIMWAIFLHGGPPSGPCENFCKEHNIYLMYNGLYSPDGSHQSSTFHYHYLNVLDGIVPPDLSKIFPEIYGLDTEFGKVGTLVCMEGASTLPARKLIGNETKLLVTFSGNEGYAFPGLIGGNATLRAAEHRVPAVLLLSPEMESLIVDPYGRIDTDVAPEEEIIAGKPYIVEDRTFYTKYGDVFGWSIAFVGITLVAYNFYLKRKSLFEYCKRCGAEIKKGTKVCEKCGKKKKEERPLWKRILLHEYYEHVKGE